MIPGSKPRRRGISKNGRCPQLLILKAGNLYFFSMKHIYCISGFGADERLFKKMAFPRHEFHFIKWITPDKNESIESYAGKLIKQIKHENPILMGLSFGGIMCTEIAAQLPVELIILISSVKHETEMPFWMHLSGRLKLNKFLPMRPFKIIEPLEDYNLGVETPEERELVHAYRKNLDLVYSDWAINAILHWKAKPKHKNLFHIHGDNDRIFRFKKISADYTVKGGGHLMILNKSEEVNERIRDILAKNMALNPE